MFHQFFQQLNNQNNFLEYFSETSPASPIATNDVSNFVDDWDYRLELHSEPLLNFSAGNHELPPPSKVGDYTYANQVVDYFEPRKFMQNSVGISILKKKYNIWLTISTIFYTEPSNFIQCISRKNSFSNSKLQSIAITQ